jgi:hypothetical protein
VPEALEVADKVPQVALLQPEPVSFHVTPLFCESFCTVAVMLPVFPVCTELKLLDNATLTSAWDGAVLVIVIFVDADLVVSATDVAVNVRIAGEGLALGAVYVIAVPEALDVADNVPHAVPVQPEPVSFQVTPLFCESFCTVAVTLAVLPTCTDPAVLDSVTTIAAGAAVIVM